MSATGDRAVLDERRPVPRGPPVPAGRGRGVRAAGGLGRRRNALRARRPRHRPRPDDGRARPAADRELRLERRLQPRRAARAAARACSWAGCSATCSGRFAALCEERGDARAGARYRADARPPRDDARAGAGTATGTGAPTSTTAAPLGSPQNEEGRIDSVAQTWAVLSGTAPRARAERAMDSVRAHLVRREPAGRPPARPRPSTAPRSTRDTSRATSRASARTAGSTRTRRRGSCSRWRASDTATRRSSSSTCSTRSNHSRTRADVERYKTEPYVARRRRLRPSGAPRARRVDLVHGLGRLDVPRGRRRDLRARAAGAVFSIDPCIASSWPSCSLEWRFGRTRYTIVVENPERALPRRRGRHARRERRSPPDAVPLVDDGASHRVLVRLGAQ